jgi:DegV family protein with EDD domain
LSKIRIVTDSTAYLPETVIKQHNITVVSLVINFKGETYPELSTYTNAEFFKMVGESPTLPTTSQPPAGEFAAAFEKLFAEGAEEIICITLSSGISGTYNSAKTAVEMLETDKVHVIDSKTTVKPQAYMVLEAVERAERGESSSQIIEAIEAMKKQVKLFFVVQSLDNLRKGGRIGGAASLFGTLLQVKPILYLTKEGIIDVFDKVRTKTKAWARVVEELDASLASGKPHKVTLINVCAREEAEQLAKDLREKYPKQEIDIQDIGKVIGTHVGAGTVGVAFYPLEG